MLLHGATMGVFAHLSYSYGPKILSEPLDPMPTKSFHL